MMILSRVRPLLAALIVASLGTSAWTACAEGSPLTAEQMACCVMSHHECGPISTIEQCCSKADEVQQQFIATKRPPQLPAPTTFVDRVSAAAPLLAVSARISACRALDQAMLKLPDEPTYLLLSVFLI